MYKRILVGLDGSKHGLNAAETGIGLAKACGSEVHFLTVTRPYKVSPQLRKYLQAENLLGEPKYVMDEMTQSIVDEAQDMAERAELKNFKTEVREGKPARAIVDYADANDVDLIIVGSRGIGDIEAALLGSVSQKVSMLAHCQVTIVR